MKIRHKSIHCYLLCKSGSIDMALFLY